MLDVLWGYKTDAIFDVWTVEHLLTGISVGSTVVWYNKKNLGAALASLSEKLFQPKKINWLKAKYDIIFVLFLAFLWETLEHYLEAGLAGGAVEYWMQGVEFWANRLIADPGLLVVGYLIARKLPVLVWPARVLSLTWLLTHVFIFPHSMYLHDLFF